jgi:hypothetical protein
MARFIVKAMDAAMCWTWKHRFGESEGMYIVNTEVIIWLHSVNKKTEVGGQEMMQVRR